MSSTPPGARGPHALEDVPREHRARADERIAQRRDERVHHRARRRAVEGRARRGGVPEGATPTALWSAATSASLAFVARKAGGVVLAHPLSDDRGELVGVRMIVPLQPLGSGVAVSSSVQTFCFCPLFAATVAAPPVDWSTRGSARCAWCSTACGRSASSPSSAMPAAAASMRRRRCAALLPLPRSKAQLSRMRGPRRRARPWHRAAACARTAWPPAARRRT